MNLIFLILIITLAGAFFAAHVAAQGAMPRSPNDRFSQGGPEVGDMVPDLVIVDDKGNPANLRKLTEGHYSVFILGCLT